MVVCLIDNVLSNHHAIFNVCFILFFRSTKMLNKLVEMYPISLEFEMKTVVHRCFRSRNNYATDRYYVVSIDVHNHNMIKRCAIYECVSNGNSNRKIQFLSLIQQIVIINTHTHTHKKNTWAYPHGHSVM